MTLCMALLHAPAAQVRSVMEPMLAHMAMEEAELLPRLAAMMEPAMLLQLGVQFHAATVC